MSESKHNMDTYSLCTALTNADSIGEITAKLSSTIMPYSGIEFNVTVYDQTWEYILSPLSIRSNLLNGDITDYRIKRQSEIRNSWVLCCCWLVVQKCWPDLYYNVITPKDCGYYYRGLTQVRRLYTNDNLSIFIQLEEYQKDMHNMYLLVSLILGNNFKLGSNWKGTGSSINILGDIENCSLNLYVDDEERCDWNSSGRRLYYHMQSINF